MLYSKASDSLFKRHDTDSFHRLNRVWDVAAAYAMLIAAGRKIVFIKNKPFPLRQISAEMPKLRWYAGTRSFIARAEQLGLI